MGTYLGQLPPAEFARFKAELAETLIANFSYPRFYDYRTGSLRMRPVDRAKRQEVWLYLSSFDFTPWSRIDVTSADFQNQVERLFIQFVQRNRAFFGEQGRKRMADIRTLLSSAANAVVQAFRAHLQGQKQQDGRAFGSPIRTPSWSAPRADGVAESEWEQVANNAMELQQQLQEARGETRGTAPAESDRISSNGNSSTRRPEQAPTIRGKVNTGRREDIPPPSITGVPPQQPQDERPISPAARQTASSAPPKEQAMRGRKSEPLRASVNLVPQQAAPTQARNAAPATTGQRDVLTLGEDDMAIFEQLRHQMLLWLRIESLRAGVEVGGQSPAQLLDTLRQQARMSETRLQVVSTLLNLSNQVMKTGQVSILDYKQALMFHLMHTRD
ncbi:MAG TPA: hypothetical protein VH593_22385 [Ktedonobacteraceae bacterium]|jgi:hypothetical protein